MLYPKIFRKQVTAQCKRILTISTVEQRLITEFCHWNESLPEEWQSLKLRRWKDKDSNYNINWWKQTLWIIVEWLMDILKCKFESVAAEFDQKAKFMKLTVEKTWQKPKGILRKVNRWWLSNQTTIILSRDKP